MNPINEIPSHDQLTEALKSLSPEPSDRLYDLISDAPWHTRGRPRRRPGSFHWNRAWVAACSLLLVAGVTAFFAYNSRALAQGLGRFFSRAAKQLIVFQAVDKSQPEEISGLSLENVKDLAAFDLLVPTEVPYPFVFQGASYKPGTQTVTLNYSRRGRILRITEQPFPFRLDEHPTGQIGPDAVVTAVEIAGNPGEVVTGTWRLMDDVDDGQLSAEWTSDAPARILRWQVGGIYVEIFTAGGSPGHPGYLSESDLISLAETLILDGVR